MKKTLKYRIHLFSQMLGNYAPTIHPLQDTRGDAINYAKKNLKLEENLSGKGSFKIEPEYV